MVGYMHYKHGGNGQVYDRQVRIIVSFRGRLDQNRLKKALRLTYDAEPVTGCRFVERPFRPYWQRCADLDSTFHFSVVDPADQEKIINKYFYAPLDPFAGPQIHIGLFRSDSDTLCIKMSHIVADGGASIEYLRLLADIYRRLGEDPNYMPVSNPGGNRSSFQALKHVKLSEILSSVAHLSVVKRRYNWEFPGLGNGPASPSFFIRRIGRERFSRIKAYAKNHGVTIGDVLLTSYYRVLFDLIESPENIPLAMLVPVDLRKYIPGGRSEGMCSLTAGYVSEVIRKKGESFEETLARVHALMEGYKSTQEELGQLFLLELAAVPRYLWMQVLSPLILQSMDLITFSNMGVIDPARANFGDIEVKEIIPAGPMLSQPCFILGSHTFNGELALTTSIYGTAEYTALIENFFEALIRELPEYAEDEVDTVRNEIVTEKSENEVIEVDRKKSVADA